MKFKVKTEGRKGEELEFATKFNEILDTMPEALTKQEAEENVKQVLKDLFGTKEGGELNIEFITQIKDMNDSEKQGSIKNILAKQGNAINDLLSKIGHTDGANGLDDFEKEWKASEVERKTIKTNQAGSKSFTIKAAAVTTTTGSVGISAGATIQRVGDGPVFEIQRGLPFVLQFVTVGNTDSSVLVWFDEVPKEGNFAITPEGTVKPLIQYKFIKRIADYVKAAGRTIITEEFEMDYPRLVSKIRELMQVDCRNFMTSDILTDMIANASPYAYNGLDDQIASPDRYAAIGATIAQLQSLFFTPNVLVLNPADAWAMRLTKDLDGRYQMSPLNMPNGTTYEFGTVIVDPRVAVGSFFVGDGSVYHVDLRGDIQVRVGFGTGDFEANQYTMIVEQFYYKYISTARKPGFIYAQFATVQADIAA